MGLAEIAPDVYLLRQPVLDVNATLIVGGEVCSAETQRCPTFTTQRLRATQ